VIEEFFNNFFKYYSISYNIGGTYLYLIIFKIMSLIKFKRGLEANLVALSGSYNVGEPYFTTDSGKFFVAKSTTLLVEYPNLASVESAIASSLAASKAYTDTAVSNLINSAPGTLDTLKEIADYISVTGEWSVAAAITNSVTAAKAELKGTVTEAFDTLKEVETELSSLNTKISNLSSSAVDEVANRTAAIATAIATEVTNRNSAISTAIATEVTDRNSAVSTAIATEVTDRNTAIATAVATIDGGSF